MQQTTHEHIPNPTQPLTTTNTTTTSNTDYPTPTPPPYSTFTPRHKLLLTLLASTAATFTSLSSNIYFPALPAIASSLSASPSSIALTVTAYMVFQGLSPSLWGAISDTHGRRVTYLATLAVYLCACTGLAVAKSFAQLLVLRCLQSTGSASTVAVGAGVVGDVTTGEERGGYMGVFQAGLLIPLAVGPVLGGALAEGLGWRAIFWFLAIYAAVFLVVLGLLLPETLRALVGDGSVPARGLARSPLEGWWRGRARRDVEVGKKEVLLGEKKRVDLFGALRILGRREVAILVAFLSVYYTVWQMTVVAMSSLFKTTYHLSELQLGLTYIANGVGCIMGTLLTGKLLDRDYRSIKKRHVGSLEDFPLEYARLRQIWFYAGLQIASTLVFGWTVGEDIHISVPIIATFVIGWAATSIQSAITTFLVDVFPRRSASATAALNLARCLVGAGGTAAVLPVADAIGVGWTFSMFAGIMLMSTVLLFVQMKFGAIWRRARAAEDANG